MPVPVITYEAIVAFYGEAFARQWFRPVSSVPGRTL